MFKDRIKSIMSLMRTKDIDAYIVVTADYHQSEYVGDFFKTRAYLSGFTGSAGTLLITKDASYLWTDGRYFIQAAKQLQNAGTNLMKMGIEGVKSLEEFLYEYIENNARIGFDAKTMSVAFVNGLKGTLKDKNVALIDIDLANEIWNNRPALPATKVFLYDEKYCGESRIDKIERIRNEMRKQGTTSHLVTALDDIAWIFNIRGRDIHCNPVVLSYAFITLDEVYLYVQENVLSNDIIDLFTKEGIIVEDYFAIYDKIETYPMDSILLDANKVNYALASKLNGKKIVNKTNPSTLYKAVKNSAEIEATRNAHIKDGVAVTKFMYWLKTTIGKEKITEISASDYLERLRREQVGFIEPSFDTISGYKENAALMHYSATKETDATLQQEGLLLVDSGGQYYEGTTDITRTFALGDITKEERIHFTAVLRGMLALQHAVFLEGCVGMNLDILARTPLWEMDIDYQCGTGHGVGHLLNVHEGPNGFHWKLSPRVLAVLEEGMITTNEPGVYIEGSHGVRIENELLCVKGNKNEYGQFMHFDVLTMAPIDLDAIDSTLLSNKEKQQLNDYHQLVFTTISPYLNEEETEWLKKYTRSI